jgi:hypothetical protein
MENGLVRHILLARIREGTSPDALDAVMAGFRQLPKRIEGVLAFEHGVNNSPEAANRGFTYIVSLTFASRQARNTYLPHPEHLKLVQLVGELGIVEEMLVFDYTPLE